MFICEHHSHAVELKLNEARNERLNVLIIHSNGRDLHTDKIIGLLTAGRMQLERRWPHKMSGLALGRGSGNIFHFFQGFRFTIFSKCLMVSVLTWNDKWNTKRWKINFKISKIIKRSKSPCTIRWKWRFNCFKIIFVSFVSTNSILSE